MAELRSSTIRPSALRAVLVVLWLAKGTVSVVALPATDYDRMREAAAVRAAIAAAGVPRTGPVRRVGPDHYSALAGGCTVDAFLSTRRYLKGRPQTGPRSFDVLVATPKC